VSLKLVQNVSFQYLFKMQYFVLRQYFLLI
jgi:hypothetical protein